MNTIVNAIHTNRLRFGTFLLLMFLMGGLLPSVLRRSSIDDAAVSPSPDVPPSFQSVSHPGEELTSHPSSEPALQSDGQDVVNVLLIGYDAQPGEAATRSDTILLCTLHKQSKQLIMTSILRDLYVPIPGYGKNRINAAYAFGGRALLRQTLETNFDISIDTSLEVDFSGFAEIVDILGGVTLELRQDEAEAISKSTSGQLAAGNQLLNGSQALAYARIRKLDADGDFSRTARQRRLLEALLQGCRSAKPLTLLSLLKQILPLITADTGGDSLFSLAMELLPILTDVEISGRHIPAEGTYSYETIRGMSVLVADMDAAKQLLRQTQQSTGSG